jgi:hypothetical protein
MLGCGVAFKNRLPFVFFLFLAYDMLHNYTGKLCIMEHFLSFQVNMRNYIYIFPRLINYVRSFVNA